MTSSRSQMALAIVLLSMSRPTTCSTRVHPGMGTTRFRRSLRTLNTARSVDRRRR